MLIRSEIEKMVKETWADKAGDKIIASEKSMTKVRVFLAALSAGFSLARHDKKIEEDLLKHLKVTFSEQVITLMCCNEIIEMCITRMAEYEVELDALKNKLESNAVAIENTPVANEHVE